MLVLANDVDCIDEGRRVEARMMRKKGGGEEIWGDRGNESGFLRVG